MLWWEEIKTAGGAINICFGGPTGLCTLVVLMAWWCSLLKDRLDNELVDCLCTLEDIDRAVLSAVCDTDKLPPTAPSPGGSLAGTSTIPPGPRPRGSKRTISGGPSSRKRLRSGKA